MAWYFSMAFGDVIKRNRLALKRNRFLFDFTLKRSRENRFMYIPVKFIIANIRKLYETFNIILTKL